MLQSEKALLQKSDTSNCAIAPSKSLKISEIKFSCYAGRKTAPIYNTSSGMKKVAFAIFCFQNILILGEGTLLLICNI
jgi:hypothetical protein